jgi:uncharacterized protein YyaL (SSP411 family)
MLLRPACLVALLVALALQPVAADEPKQKDKDAPKAKPNRLAKSSSPYLLQHANNPVDWYPWGTEAFERAKKDKKLIFLSVGYSSCHWCHVMERESFSNAEIAKILNENFVCIKVDREERPDIDDIYMTALSVTDVQGGWPLTMILTSEGKPIFGGTYFPPEDKKVGEDTIPGMKSILARVIELDKKEHGDLEKQAEHIAKLTVESNVPQRRPRPFQPRWVTRSRGKISPAATPMKNDPRYEAARWTASVVLNGRVVR